MALEIYWTATVYAREWLPCPECSGEGEDAGDCNGCGGWGAYEGEPCGRCEGSGDCPACDGRRETGRSTEWVRIGTARVNRDGSISVHLDALPIDGMLMIREEVSR